MLATLEPNQFETISDFGNDIAKGIMLAVIIGQGTIISASVTSRIIFSILWVLASFLMLYFALIRLRGIPRS